MTHPPDAVLIELLGYVCGRGTAYGVLPPTPTSLDRVSRELNVTVPSLFAEAAQMCPGYGDWFASIGEDYDNEMHILQLNRWFHAQGLPSHFIILNHGHDGDCDSWDLTAGGPPTEHPIVHVRVTEGEAQVVEVLASSFRGYLEWYCRNQVSRIGSRSLRRKAKTVLAAYDNSLS